MGSDTTNVPRLAFIDNLRTMIIVLVIMVHLSITYGGEGSWYYEESEPDLLTGVVLTLHNAINQSFFMGCLFLISGYLTPASYDRKGPRRFLLDRVVRLGLPMLFYDMIIHPFMVYWLGRNGVTKLGSFRDWAASYYTTFHIGHGPLWFVEALLLFSVAYMIWRLLRAGAPRPNSFGRADSKEILSTRPDGSGGPESTGKRVCPCHSDPVPRFGSLALLAVSLGVASFLVRLLWPIGWSFKPMNLQFPFFPQYIAMFIIGIVAYRRQWLTHLPKPAGRRALILAAVFVFVVFPLLGFLGGIDKQSIPRYSGGLYWQALAMALWEQSLGIALMVGLLVLFRERLNYHSGLSRTASANSYATYVIHAPLLLVFTLAIRGIHVYPLAKFVLVTLIVVPLCFLTAALLRQLPGARRIL